MTSKVRKDPKNRRYRPMEPLPPILEPLLKIYVVEGKGTFRKYRPYRRV